MYAKIDILAELRKFRAGKKTKVTPEVLLYLISDDYLAQNSPKRK